MVVVVIHGAFGAVDEVVLVLTNQHRTTTATYPTRIPCARLGTLG